ncbi:MAG: Gfo/Idh/MocA family oxidoreductase, partial [Candidatus Omnitrophica bacterium]|nr:Gfo/Idh/MocA family oxidoreductase [Candidatus Omnitrophota bacterium]
MDKIGYGVIGLGFFGEKHTEVLSTMPNVKLLGVCRRSVKPLKEIATKYGVPNTYTDYNELLANKEIEAVSITTMWDQHLAPTLAALKAGKHVFLEKPMASTVQECKEIVQAAKATQHFFMVGHICRFNPRYAMAKSEISEGAIGKIVSIYARRNIPATVSEGVLGKIGPIIGDGVHDTDLMLWYTEAKVKTVYANTVSVRKLANPDIGWTMYRFDTGAIGVCENVWFLPEKTPFQIDERMEIIGTEGSIHIQETSPNLSVCDKNGWRSPDTTYWPMLHSIRTGALREELSYFVNC